jgi:hypothetical protein
VQEIYVTTAHFHGWDWSKYKKQPEFSANMFQADSVLKDLNKKYSYEDLVQKRYPKGLDTSKLEVQRYAVH